MPGLIKYASLTVFCPIFLLFNIESIKKDFHIKQQSLRLALLIALSLGLGACGGELEPGEGGTPPTTTPPLAPTTTPPTTPPTTDPVEHQGTWENKDEDGDGVPDEQDDYPFDASKSAFFILQESEQNNLVETADDVAGHFPFRILGTLPNAGDTDVFKISFPTEQVSPDDRLSITILSSSSNFYPTANLFDKNGTQLDTHREDNIKPVNGFKYHLIYFPNGNTTAYLSISSLRQVGEAAYIALVSIDSDSDGMADITEMALGMNPHAADTDNDGIQDSYEYYVYKNGQLNTDIDNDGIANFLDDDSDDDGLPDWLESFTDADKDSLGNFVDTDSDGNNIIDAVEAINQDIPVDTDADKTPDYIDLDDDADDVFDIYDSNRLVQVDEPDANATEFKLYGVNTILSEQTQLSRQSIQGQTISLSGTFANNTEYTLVLRIGYELFNQKVVSDSHGKLRLKIPQLSILQTSSLASSVFVYSSQDIRTNTSQFELLAPQVPIITEFENKTYAKGEVITLKGWNFNKNTSAWFGELKVPSSNFTSSKEIEFKIPNDIAQFSMQLQNGWGKGNSHRLKIKNEFSIRLSAPKALSSQYDRLYYYDADGNVKEFNASGVTVVDLPALNDPMLTLYVKKDAEYIKLYALSIQGNGVQTVSLDTTLFAWLTYGHPKLTLEPMKTNPSYPALYDYVYNQLQQDIYFFSFADANAQNAFFEKLRSFGNAIK
jgi:hypothetical protein